MIKFKLKEVKPSVFAVIVKNKYDRAMLFCRAQEYYESPNPTFKNKSFSIWDYIKWYSLRNNGFSYPFDWSGFNFPYEVAQRCYSISKIENKYDELFKHILICIEKQLKNNKGYIIGVESLKDDTYRHEMCHALYHTNSLYRISMDNIMEGMDKNTIRTLSKNIKSMGYTSSVVKDEIQAYMTIDYDYKKFNRGIPKTKLIKHNRIFFDNFMKFFL
jgi:hypothetical protein